MQKIKYSLLLILLIPCIALAWNSTGHKLVAEIAYQHLSRPAKHQVRSLVQTFSQRHKHFRSLQMLAIWPDVLVRKGITAFNTWHYIDTPYSQDGVRAPRYINPANVVWAIGQAKTVIQDPQANRFQKARFLAFLAHFVGDIHQPLHCIELYSKRTPHGDRGGNLYLINAGKVKKLHTYWDRGLGLFSTYYPKFPRRFYQIRKLAKIIEKRYPPSFFGKKKILDNNPEDWARESYRIAKNFAYTIPWKSKPTTEYITKGQQIAEQRIALAGYRLAVELNEIFKN